MKSRIPFSELFLRGFRPYAWLILLVTVLYGPTLLFDFVYYDDNVLIKDNQAFLSSPANVGKAFTQHYFAADTPMGRYYRPLVTLSYMTDTWLGAGKPWAYHATNVILFSLASCLLFLLLNAIVCFGSAGPTGPPQPAHSGPVGPAEPPRSGLAFLASLFFAAHPLQAMAVSWIPGRNDTLLACFFISSLWAFIRYRQTRALPFLWAHLALIAMALLTKETAVCIPVFGLAWFWFVEADRDWKTWLDRTPLLNWFAIGIGWFVLRGIALGLFAAGNPTGPSLPITTKLITLVSLGLRYYGKIAFPFHLALVPDPAETPLIYGSVFALATLFVYWKSGETVRKMMIFGLCGSAAILSLSIPFSDPMEIKNLGLLEHRMVVPWIGVLIALVSAAVQVKLSGPRWMGAAALSIVLLASMSIRRLPAFIDACHFWSVAVLESPTSSDAWHNFGNSLMFDFRYEESEAAYRHALKLDPGRALSHLNIAYIYSEQKRLQESIEECYLELKNEPYSIMASDSLATLYMRSGAPALARDWRERANKLRAGQPVPPLRK